MFIFKRKRAGVESRDWYCRFNDCSGIQRELRLFGDKKASEYAGANLERLRDFRQAGRALDAGLLDFVESLPPGVRLKLVNYGFLDKAQAVAGMALSQVRRSQTHNKKVKIIITGGHLLDYENSLKARELAPRHILQVINHCQKVIEGCVFVYLSDIDGTRVEQYLRTFRDSGKSARTFNTVLQAFRSFCEWLCNEGRLSGNPVKRIDTLNEQADKRYLRGAMTEQEISLLLAATSSGGHHHGLCGLERSLIYRLSLETGLRWNEVYTLQRVDFNLVTPAVAIRAKNAKNKKPDLLPLSPGLANDLQKYFEKNPALPLTRAFAGMWVNRGADMMREDLTAAGISDEDETGRILDFHSLRHTCGTRLAKAGVQPQVAQRIMRHSTMEMTLRYYTHLSLENKAQALAKLPAIIALPLLKTGTDYSLQITDTETDTNGCPFSVHNRHFVSHLGSSELNGNSALFVSTKTASPELTDTCGIEKTGISMGIRTPVVSVKSICPKLAT